MVETAGIEPASESVSSEPSPGADGYSGSRPGSPHRVQAVTRVGSGSFIMRAVLKALHGHGRHLNDTAVRLVALPAAMGSLKRLPVQKTRCSLIYKMPILRMVGASARLFRLRTPVETFTSP